MHFQLLPNTALNVSSLCFGTADMGAGIDEATSFALLDQFAAAGGNFLDTAAIYADWTPAGKGSSERVLGKWLRLSDHEMIVATKGAHPDLNAMNVSRLNRAAIESDVNGSLANLGHNAIDLYYLHRDDESVPVADILEILEGFVAQGKIRYYGFSNWKLPRAQEALALAKEHSITGFVANQPMWSLAQADLSTGDQTLVSMPPEYQQWHIETGLPAIPYASQANGYFNKLAAGKEIKGLLAAQYESSTNRARAGRSNALAAETGLSITQIGLGYLLSQPFPVVPIIGCRNAEQLADSLSGADVKLTPDQVSGLIGSS